MNVKGRVGKLEDRLIGELIMVKLKGGGTATLPSRDMLGIFIDALKGVETPETRIALAAESSNEDGGMLVLLQAVLASRDLAKTESEEMVQMNPPLSPVPWCACVSAPTESRALCVV